jgi:hypothetical protein
MTKTFPRSRICVIDCFPSFESGLQKAYKFANTHNISLNSTDGKKLVLSFCLETIKESYDSTKSQFPKVICISNKANNNKIKHFVDTHFDKMMSCLSIPYCGKYDLASPDLEMAAESSLKNQKTKRQFNEFKAKLNLRNVN